MKKGFTLVEVLVAIAVSTILLSMLVASFYFITRLSTNVIDEASNNYQLFNVRDYIINNDINSNVSVDNGDVIYNDSVIAYDTNITNISFNGNECIITYIKNNNEYNLVFLIE